MNKLAICRRTRETTTNSLYIALKNLLSKDKPISEVNLRDAWLLEMRKNEEIFPDGWYTPPPFGITVLFATPKNQRADFTNLRPEKYWPREDIFLDRKNGYAYLFSSPIDRKTAIAGDFSINIYFGNDKKIINHLKSSLQVDKKIYEFIQTGMMFYEIFQHASTLIEQSGLRNNIISVTDPSSVNTGHTIPFSYEDLSKDKKRILDDAETNWEKFTTMISNKRRFVSTKETLKVKPEMAFTIEPALKVSKNPKIPMTMFHNTVLIRENGEKELLTNFDDIFNLCGMDYMLNVSH